MIFAALGGFTSWSLVRLRNKIKRYRDYNTLITYCGRTLRGAGVRRRRRRAYSDIVNSISPPRLVESRDFRLCAHVSAAASTLPSDLARKTGSERSASVCGTQCAGETRRDNYRYDVCVPIGYDDVYVGV